MTKNRVVGFFSEPERGDSLDRFMPHAPERSAGVLGVSDAVAEQKKRRSISPKAAMVLSSAGLVAAYGYGKFAPFVDPVTTFLNDHFSYVAAAPAIGFVADRLANSFNRLRGSKLSILAAGGLALGAALIANGVYETDAGYQMVGESLDDNVFDPANVVENRVDPIDTLMTLSWVGAAMLFARHRQAKQ